MPGTYLNHYQDHLKRIAEYSDLVTRLQTVDATLAQIETDIANIPGGGGGSAGSVISVNASQLIAPLIANLPELDLIYLLGTSTNGFVNPHPERIAISASDILAGFSVTTLTNKIPDTFATTDVANSWVRIDFGANRDISLSGMGLTSRGSGTFHAPLSLTIEGSNDGTNYSLIHQWNNIGFTTINQNKTVAFPTSPSYRYVRVRQPGLDNLGLNFLVLSEVYLYGTLTIAP